MHNSFGSEFMQSATKQKEMRLQPSF